MVWYIYLHLPYLTIKNKANVGKYTNPMDDMGYDILKYTYTPAPNVLNEAPVLLGLLGPPRRAFSYVFPVVTGDLGGGAGYGNPKLYHILGSAGRVFNHFLFSTREDHPIWHAAIVQLGWWKTAN